MKLSSQYIDILLSKCTEKETDNKFAHKKTRENAENDSLIKKISWIDVKMAEIVPTCSQ